MECLEFASFYNEYSKGWMDILLYLGEKRAKVALDVKDNIIDITARFSDWSEVVIRNLAERGSQPREVRIYAPALSMVFMREYHAVMAKNGPCELPMGAILPLLSKHGADFTVCACGGSGCPKCPMEMRATFGDESSVTVHWPQDSKSLRRLTCDAGRGLEVDWPDEDEDDDCD